MLGWLKNKIGLQQQPRQSFPKAEAELRAQLAPLEKVPNAKRGIVDRVVGFILTGDGESVLGELAALKHTGGSMKFSVVRYGNQTNELSEYLAWLVKLLPEDPELYLRLARVYETAKVASSLPSSFSYIAVIPPFTGTLSWLDTFLIELSQAGKRRDFFPARLLQQMIAASGADPSTLVKAAFFYEDANGKTQISKWTSARFVYFQCLLGFAELVHDAPDVVRPAFKQKDAISRATALRAIAALDISPEHFADEIATLAVSGSK